MAPSAYAATNRMTVAPTGSRLLFGVSEIATPTAVAAMPIARHRGAASAANV